jgi:leader peptidase (prepilin peptidase) / N-methyltransferase
VVVGVLWVGLAALLGGAAALALRGRRYRYADDDVRRSVNPLWVPAAAVLGALLAAPFWRAQPAPVLLTYVLALVWALVLTLVDLEVHRLPDVLTLPAYPVAAALLAWCSATTGAWSALAVAAASSGGAVLAFLVALLVSPGGQGLGLGDVKLAGVLGALLGWFAWEAAVYGLLAGFVLGGVVAVVLLAARRADRRSALSFGPAMVAGAYLVALTLPVLVA